jgi:hypothetical protein
MDDFKASNDYGSSNLSTGSYGMTDKGSGATDAQKAELSNKDKYGKSQVDNN